MGRVVVIAGPPGSGKTTVARILAETTGASRVSAGDLFRRMAKEAGLSLEAFGRRAAEDHAIDRKLDREILAEVTRRAEAGEDVVVDSRIQAHFLAREGVEALTVWLDAPLTVRAQRVAGREGQTLDAARRAIRRREDVEARRYRAIYGIDLGDRAVYDLTVETADLAPEEVAERIRREAGL